MKFKVTFLIILACFCSSFAKLRNNAPINDDNELNLNDDNELNLNDDNELNLNDDNELNLNDDNELNLNDDNELNLYDNSLQRNYSNSFVPEKNQSYSDVLEIEYFEDSLKKLPGDDFDLLVGKSINIFPRYGFLSSTIKVFSTKYNSRKEIYSEKPIEIFEKNSYKVKLMNTPPTGFDSHFVIDFCGSSKDLFSTFFDNFTIEGVPEEFKAFISLNSVKSKAEAFGIHSTYLNDDDFSFILVRLFRRDLRAVLDGDLKLSESFLNATKKIRVGSPLSAHQFMDKFGSHVISAYDLGDVVYQVFVFGHSLYKELKATFKKLYPARDNFTTFGDREAAENATDVRHYFTPSFARHVGQVKMASGNEQFERLKFRLKKSYFPYRYYQSIFDAFKVHELTQKIVDLKEQVITGLTLKKITSAMQDSRERNWLGEILDNSLSLYYTTL